MKKNKKISISRMGPLLLFVGLAFLFTGMVIPPPDSYGQRPVKPEVVLPDHYPNGFDGFGRLERIGEDEVVINDVRLKLSPSVEYYTPDQLHAAIFSAQPGDLIGFLKNSENEIISLWWIK